MLIRGWGAGGERGVGVGGGREQNEVLSIKYEGVEGRHTCCQIFYIYSRVLISCKYLPQVSLTSLLLAPLALLKTFKDFVGSEDDIKKQLK